MNLLIFMHSLKLLSQPPLHHFLLVIRKLPRNRFADFLFIYSHYVNPLSHSSHRRLQNKKAKLPFTEKCESVIFGNWIISGEIRQRDRMLCLWESLILLLMHVLSVLTSFHWGIISLLLCMMKGVSETSDNGHRSRHSPQ